MKTKDAAAEILALLEQGRRNGAPPASQELLEFLVELQTCGGLKKARNQTVTRAPRDSGSASPRVGARRQRPTGAEMAKTIEELAKRLRDSFENAATFENLLTDPVTQGLSKANVVTLYNTVFDQQPAKSMTKPEIFNAMRRERINRVRGQR